MDQRQIGYQKRMHAHFTTVSVVLMDEEKILGIKTVQTLLNIQILSLVFTILKIVW